MLEKVKLALRISTDAFDAELSDLIDAALADLGVVGISTDVLASPEAYPLIARAVITYVKLNFGEPAEPDRLRKAYEAQRATLSLASGYREN